MKMLGIITIFATLSMHTNLSFAQSTLSSGLTFSTYIDPVLKKQILNDLKMISSITFSKTSVLHQKIFGKSNPYLRWFKARIKTIVPGQCSSDGGSVICVMPFFEQNKMRVTKKYLESDSPQIAKLTILFHEAKHTEPNPILHEGDPDLRYWLHVNCPPQFLDENNQPIISTWTGLPISGLPACDIASEGGYGTAVVMLKNIAQNSTNTSEKIRADAEIYSKDQLIRIIDSKAHDQIVNDQ